MRAVAFSTATPVISLSVYPNPAGTETTVLLTGLPTATYQVSIIDATGRLVRHLTVSGLSRTLDLRDLAAGSYALLVRGTAPNGTAFNLSQRVVKE